MTLTFEPLSERTGFAVVDPVERQRYRVHTPEAVSPAPADTTPFRFPVGDAVRLRTRSLVLPTVVPVYVRDADGDLLEEVTQFQAASFEDGAYCLDLCTQIKTYARVGGPFEVSVDMDRTRIEFDSPTDVSLGARSRHDRPKATVTTTDDPRDLMTAVETFGSGLQTTDPERSYPTLRGHPPAVELGETLSVPPAVEPPETGVTLELPPDPGQVFVAAPLAYYLGASLEPAAVPRLVTDSGFEYSLDSARGYEREVERTLKQLFVLDCVTRTEGLYEVDLHERRAIEPYVDLEFGALYDRPLADQVAAYLDVPYDVVAEHVPEWRLTTHVEPTASSVEQLPFVVDDLAVVRTHGDHRSVGATLPAEAESAFTREDVITRSTTADAGGGGGSDYVEPTSADTLEQAWIGDSIPIGASKLTRAAFEHRLSRATSEGDIEITVVQNDARMDAEREVADTVYGDRADLPFAVTVRQDLTTEELADLLETQTDFLHYIGHTDREGFTCSDGKLDAATLESVGVDTFLLNACNSYHQGLALVEQGAIGGIVTLNEVINDEAVTMGATVARLLNCGFPLRAALTVAREESILGGQYIVVGDGGIAVTQPASGTPTLLEVSEKEEGYELAIDTYPTDNRGLGSLFNPYVEGNKKYYLSSGRAGTFSMNENELNSFLSLENVPVRFEDELSWAWEFKL